MNIALLSIAILFAFGGIVIWYALLRPVPQLSVQGEITNAYLADAETLERLVPRSHRGLDYVPLETSINIPERYIYEISLEGRDDVLKFSNMNDTLEFPSGTKVTVVLSERSLPLVWHKLFVHEVVSIQ